ncbi:hypothetical protein [Nocardia sp. CS682]|uniref:hypothetical protein n=1 Tax=Nocardia sp. CS682 TaxID=1047172 RepID=UPI001074DD6B|nr:hypothetical protein [Nocardia sp. CS682]QBS44832.1 hypothetical protein DMB37_36900 [Nocardia sp. CS682]
MTTAVHYRANPLPEKQPEQPFDGEPRRFSQPVHQFGGERAKAQVSSLPAECHGGFALLPTI